MLGSGSGLNESGSKTLVLGWVKIHNLINFCRDEDGEAATAGIVSVFSSAMALLRYYTQKNGSHTV
jgi:hypothetical protein